MSQREELCPLVSMHSCLSTCLVTEFFTRDGREEKKSLQWRTYGMSLEVTVAFIEIPAS